MRRFLLFSGALTMTVAFLYMLLYGLSHYTSHGRTLGVQNYNTQVRRLNHRALGRGSARAWERECACLMFRIPRCSVAALSHWLTLASYPLTPAYTGLPPSHTGSHWPGALSHWLTLACRPLTLAHAGLPPSHTGPHWLAALSHGPTLACRPLTLAHTGLPPSHVGSHWSAAAGARRFRGASAE